MSPSPLRALRRAQIIAAARRIVAERGLEAMTIGAIEDALDFSRGVITYHFKNKDEIVIAVLDSAIAEIDAATDLMVRASLTPQQKVEAVLRANVQGFVAHTDAGRILLSFWGRLSAHPGIEAVNVQLFRRYRAQSVCLIREGQALGVFADADAVAALIVGIVIGLATQALIDPAAIDPEPAIRAGAAAVNALLSTPR